MFDTVAWFSGMDDKIVVIQNKCDYDQVYFSSYKKAVEFLKMTGFVYEQYIVGEFFCCGVGVGGQ